jgi:uncharacterized PurR-regulated membrane protein YhhQ (DUF165 family)
VSPRGLVAVALYAAAIVGANALTSRYGMVPVGFGLVATAGTYAAGLALGLRDVVQDTAGRRAVLAAVLAGAALSWWLSTPTLAVASGVAFLASEVADFAVYTPLRRHGWSRAVIASNTAGAVVDTVLFLALAGFPVTAASVSGQLVGKVLWATLLPVAMVGVIRRALPRYTLDASGT